LLGLALAETVAQNTNPADWAGGWGRDFSGSPYAENPWFMRGGGSNDATAAGVFAFYWRAGGAHVAIGWRLPL